MTIIGNKPLIIIHKGQKHLLQVQEEKLKHWKFALDSMKKEELERYHDSIVKLKSFVSDNKEHGIKIER